MTSQNKILLERILSFLQRQPFAFLNAIGLLSLIEGITHIKTFLSQWLDAWKELTRPIWEFLFGWIFYLIALNEEVPWWFSDYLTMSIIVFGSLIRAIKFSENITLKDICNDIYKGFCAEPLEYFWLIFRYTILWPYTIYEVLFTTLEGMDEEKLVKVRLVFLESFIYVAIVMAITYGGFFK